MQFSLNFYNKVLVKIFIVVLCIIVGLLTVSLATRFFKSATPEEKLSEIAGEEVLAANGIQIAILNSTNISGIADKARFYMRKYGFDVVEIDNSDATRPRSVIIDRIGDLKAAKITAKVFGIADSLIITEKDSSLSLQATVILGNDYKTLNPFK